MVDTLTQAPSLLEQVVVPDTGDHPHSPEVHSQTFEPFFRVYSLGDKNVLAEKSLRLSSVPGGAIIPALFGAMGGYVDLEEMPNGDVKIHSKKEGKYTYTVLVDDSDVVQPGKEYSSIKFQAIAPIHQSGDQVAAYIQLYTDEVMEDMLRRMYGNTVRMVMA